MPDLENNDWKTFAPYLASLPKVNPFCVPEHYLNNLPSEIKDSIYIDQLKTNTSSTGFVVPEDYFNTLHEVIRSQTNEIPSHDWAKVSGYSTPDQYFSKLQASILEQTVNLEQTVHNEKQQVQAKTIKFWATDFSKYLTAACFILVTAFALYFNQKNATEKVDYDLANEQILYDIDEQEIIEHVQASYTERKKPAATETELEDYILNNYSQTDLSTSL